MISRRSPVKHSDLGMQKRDRPGFRGNPGNGDSLFAAAEFRTKKQLPKTALRDSSDLKLLTGILSTDNSIGRPEVLAKRMLAAYGSLPAVLCAPNEDLAKLLGVSCFHAYLVKSSYEALVSSVFARLRATPPMDYEALIAMVLWTIGRSPVEKVQLFYMDRSNRVIGTEVICSGSESFVSVSIKTIIACVCRKNAGSFVIAHNHPGGSLSPSAYDLDFVDKLLRVTAMMDVSLVESLIVSGGDWYSFRKEGHL